MTAPESSDLDPGRSDLDPGREDADDSTADLPGGESGGSAAGPDRIETNLENEEDLMSADDDRLPDDEVSDPGSTPQGPPD